MGLTQQQVQERIDQGLTNESDLSTDKTTKEIIVSNTFTYFNLIFLIITVLLCLVGSFRNLTFLPIVIGNTLIGIIQEVRAKRTLDKMNLLNAPHAIVVRDGVKQKIETEQLVQDDEIILEAGNQICADAVVVEGSVQVNESLLTGEADEVEKNPGDELFSGSFVVSGRCHAELTHVGNESYIAKLSQEAKTMGSGEQSEMIRSINQIVKWVGIVIIPIGLLLFYQSHFINHETIRRSVTATVAAIIGMIPEGLYLLTTIALALSTMKLASRKVLLHDMKSIEALARVDVLCVDKTGTITSGEPKVTDIIPAEGVSEEELLQMAFALEKKSEHPLAKAILLEAERQKVRAEEVSDFQALPGNGLTASLHGSRLFGGNMKFISEICKISEKQKRQVEALAEDGKTPLFFAKEDRLLGVIAVADVIKEESARAVKELQNMGIRVVMLTGDNERTARAIGAQAGVDEVIAGVLPDGKESVIRSLKEQGKVAMVGDGINDAPALTRADIGIAIGAGTDIAIDAADVVLMKSRLSDVPASIRLSRATLRNIHENLFWAFFYNVVGIPLAAGLLYPIFGWKLNPMFGAAAMSLSSFCVVTNALRLNLFKMHDASKDHPMRKRAEKAANKGGDKAENAGAVRTEAEDIRSIGQTANENETVSKEMQKSENQKNHINMEGITMTKTMNIEGMMCGHCEARVKKALEALAGVESAEVSHEKGTAVVSMSADVADDTLKEAVEAQDYKVDSIQ